jgi:hypothetical protein
MLFPPVHPLAAEFSPCFLLHRRCASWFACSRWRSFLLLLCSRKILTANTGLSRSQIGSTAINNQTIRSPTPTAAIRSSSNTQNNLMETMPDLARRLPKRLRKVMPDSVRCPILKRGAARATGRPYRALSRYSRGAGARRFDISATSRRRRPSGAVPQGYAPPDQIVAGADAQNWDPSVKALTAFPQVLAQMNRNLQWTTDLGNAYYNQPQDVLHAVQIMRWRAQDAGSLRNTSQEAVDYQQGNIVLAPPNPQVVYVPEYNPWVVYGAPVAPYPGFSVLAAVGSFIGNAAVRFGWGIATTAFAHSPSGCSPGGSTGLPMRFSSTVRLTIRTRSRCGIGDCLMAVHAHFREEEPSRRGRISPYRRGDGFERGNGGFRNSRQAGKLSSASVQRGKTRPLRPVSPGRITQERITRVRRKRGFRSFRTEPTQPQRDARSKLQLRFKQPGLLQPVALYGQERNGRQNSEFRSNAATRKECRLSRASHSSLERNFSKHSRELQGR